MKRSQSGFITLDFLIAIVIGFGMTAILFAMTMTLTVAEIAQYITFSAARAHSGAHATPEEQTLAGRTKFLKLRESPVFAPLFHNNWFELSDPEIRSGNVSSSSSGSFKSEYPSSGSENKPIWTGVRAQFTSKILSMKLPMIGKTSDQEGLSTRVMTIMIREPSQKECLEYMNSRYSHIMKLDQRFGAYSNHEKDYLGMEDNGC